MALRILIPAALALLAACSSPAGPTAPAGSAPASEATAAEALSVTVADFMIDPPELEATGPTVTVDVTNDGPTPHNFTVRDESGEVVMATADLSRGESETVSAELEPGDYTTFCSLAGHESLGMVGTLTVTAP